MVPRGSANRRVSSIISEERRKESGEEKQKGKNKIQDFT